MVKRVLDSHLHLWDVNTLKYPWLNEAPAIANSHFLEDYKNATTDIPIEKMVFVQCETEPSQFVDEVSWVSEQAEIDQRIKGIVSWAPLEKGEAAREDLEKLKKYPLMRGIRRIIQFEEDVNFCLQPNFIRGVQLLPEYDLRFDICIKGDEQFKNTLELVKQCPDTQFILDHIGKPFIKEGILEKWSSYIAELASLPNTVCKVSGLVVEADAEKWTIDDLKPYYEVIVKNFGYNRMIFGGDWPVVNLASDYQTWYKTLIDLNPNASEEELDQLFYENGESFYGV